MSDQVLIRDRRRTPFFRVFKAALDAIRGNSEGPTRTRALGLYVLLCELANAQRHTGEHRRITATYDELIARICKPNGRSIGRTSLRGALTALGDANVAHYTVQIDPQQGRAPSVIELPKQRGRHIQITVASATFLSEQPIDLLSAFALIATLLALCDDQHADQALASRPFIASRLGWSSERTLDSHVKSLEALGVLRVTRRPKERGGHEPNLWEILEPGQSIASADTSAGHPGANPGLTPRNSRTDLAQIWDGGGANPGLTPRKSGTDLAQHQDRPGAICATSGPDAAPYARAGDVEQKKTTEPLSPPPLSDNALQRNDRGEGSDGLSAQERLCEELLEVLHDSLGEAPRRKYNQSRGEWLAAAERVLEDHTLERIRSALAYIPTDPIKGSVAITMPGFARVVDELIFRAHSASRNGRSPSQASTAPGVLPWPQARARLEQVIRRHGAERRDAAIAELAQESALYERFILRVRWSRLCEEPLHYPDFKAQWEAICREEHPTEEAVA